MQKLYEWQDTKFIEKLISNFTVKFCGFFSKADAAVSWIVVFGDILPNSQVKRKEHGNG